MGTLICCGKPVVRVIDTKFLAANGFSGIFTYCSTYFYGETLSSVKYFAGLKQIIPYKDIAGNVGYTIYDKF